MIHTPDNPTEAGTAYYDFESTAVSDALSMWPDALVARVAFRGKNSYRLWLLKDERVLELDGVVTGRLLNLADGEALPAVGDWVVVNLADDLAVIQDVLPRKSSFARTAAGPTSERQIIAANVDALVLVQGLDRDFNPSRLERYLVLARQSGSAGIVVLNKKDVCTPDELLERREAATSVAGESPLLCISAHEPEDLVQLKGQIGKLMTKGPGATIALLGSSGVGKSTIANALLEDDVQKTQTVREDDQRGRHTTTWRQLFASPSGIIILDTPGMRELQLALDDSGELSPGSEFPDIAELAEQCRFSDCKHEDEPGCAVQNALRDGRLEARRFRSYRKLLAESAYIRSRESEQAARARKDHNKRLHQTYRKIQARRRKERGRD